jgi:hypothetical protein
MVSALALGMEAMIDVRAIVEVTAVLSILVLLACRRPCWTGRAMEERAGAGISSVTLPIFSRGG